MASIKFKTFDCGNELVALGKSLHEFDDMISTKEMADAIGEEPLMRIRFKLMALSSSINFFLNEGEGKVIDV